MSQIAKARVESLLQSQSSDNSLSYDIDEAERSVQKDLPVVRTPKPSSSKHKKSKTQSPFVPPSPIVASALRDDEDYEQEEGELSPTSEDRVPFDGPISKRSRSPSEESFDPPPNNLDVEEDRTRLDRSYSHRLLAHENRRSQNPHQNNQILVPSNISINANYFTLKDSLISPSDATKLLEQCLVPGFCNSVSQNHTLILTKAQYQIDNRINARQAEWDTLFPQLNNAEIADWMNTLSVVQAANLVYTLFGPESTAMQSINQKTVDVLLRETPFALDFTNETREDTTFGKINDILISERLSNGILSSERLCELSKIISSRLPVDSQIVTTYREAFSYLTDLERQEDTPQLVINRIKKIMNQARKEIRFANKWQSQGLSFLTDKKGYPIGNTPNRQLSNTTTEAPKKTLCNVCGIPNHTRDKCNQVNLPGTNSSNLPWAASTAGKAWRLAGYAQFRRALPVPESLLSGVSGSSSSSASASSTVATTVPPATQFKRTLSSMSSCKHDIMSSVHLSSPPTPSDFLTVTVSLKSQTSRQAAEVANRTEVEDVAGAKRSVQALLDTGSLAGNFISQTVVTELNGDDYVYRSKQSFSVCSGLDNVCYESDKLINLLITYKNERSQKLQSIFLTAFVAQNSPIDLIIGRSSIKKHNFLTSNSSHFVNSDILSSLSTNSTMTHSTKVKPSEICESVTLENGMKTTVSEKSPIFSQTVNATTCGCTATHSKPMNLDLVDEDMATSKGITSSPMNLDSDQNDFCDLNHNLSDTPPLPAGLATPQRHGWVATVLKQAQLAHTAVIVDDEIDDSKTDTFLPFLASPESKSPIDFIDLITFEGDPDLIRRSRALCYKYKHLFSDTLHAKPADIPPFDLQVNDAKWRTYANRGPVRVQTPAKDAEAVKHITLLLALGIIVASTASYYSQIIIASKPDGKTRFCIDYRRLNDCTESASWPLPNIRSLLARLGTKRSDTFGVMDLTSGYHQAPLTPAAMLYTAFICYAGIYHFTRLPFGPKRAPSYFQEQMASVVLAGLIYYICEMYLDDCIVHGKGNDQFLERLELVFQRFSKHNILLQPKKCKFGMKVIEYVGRQISREGTSMSTNKIRSVVDFPKPTTNTALRSFLGLANYMRDFVRNHSTTVAPLHAMIVQSKGKSHPIKWTPKAEAAFIEIKNRINDSPLLYFDDDSEPITLMTDASDYGIGGHLFQTIKGIQRTIAFVSKSFTETQLRWSVIQKEAYAIFYCVNHLSHILRDRTFIIRTDHKNLTFISLDSNAMVIRWNIALQEFNYTLEYVPGPENTIADTLSRLCVNRMVTNPNPLILSAIQLDRIITPERLALIKECHGKKIGHGGVERTLNKILALGGQWRYMRQDVRKFIAHCPACQKMSQINLPIHTIKYIASTYHTMECLNIDFVGPYPDKGYLLVIIDTFTRWIELYPSKDATAKAALEGLLQHFGRYGCPRLIRSDRGPHFANELIAGFLKATGTPHNLTLAYSSEENAIVERSNKEVNRHIIAYTFDNEIAQHWREAIPFVHRIMNSSYSQRTKISPADLLFGKQLQLDRGILLPFSETPEDIRPLPERVATMLTLQARLVKISQDLLQASDAKHLASTSPTLTEFAIGTYVLVAYEDGPPTRLLTRWRGPMKILSHHNSEYLLLDLVTGKEKLFHVKNMRIFRFDPLSVNPLDVARRDYSEFFVEKIIEHKGDFRKVSTLTFKVRWLSYTPEYDTWEPWKNLRHLAPLHEYLRVIGKAKLIPTPKLDSNSS
jgi:hypothetical protein